MTIWETLWGESQYILKGTLVLLQLLFCILTVGFIVGTLLSITQNYGPRIVAIPTAFFKRFFLSVPPIILLLVFYFGLGTQSGYNITPFVAAIAALGLRSAAYQSQIFTGALMAVKAGQVEAAYSLGMSRWGVIRNVLLPQAYRLAVGPWTSEFSSSMKGTALAYLIGVVELVRTGKYIISYSYGNALIVYFLIAIIFLVLTRTGNTLLYRLERKVRIPGLEAREVRMGQVH